MVKKFAVIFGVILLTGSMLVGSTIQVHGLANLRALGNSELEITDTDDRLVMELERFARIGIIAGVPRAPRSNTGAISAGISRARKQLEQDLALQLDGTATIHQI